MSKVTFFVDGFPVPSHTFILNQIVAMVDSSFKVNIIAKTPSGTGFNHPDVKNYNLMEKLVTAYTTPKPAMKFFDFLTALFKDILRLKFHRLTWLFKTGIHGYMIGRRFEGVTGNVICHFGPVGSKLASLLSCGVVKDINIITVFHGYDMSINHELKKEIKGYENLFKVGSLMLPVSEFWARKLVSLGCPAEKIIVQKMGVNIDDFKYIERYNSSSPKEKIKLICVCRFVEKKGIPVLLKALKELPCNYVLTLVGGGPNYDEIFKMIEMLELSNRVRIEDFLPSNEINQRLNMSDAFVLPSITAKNGDMEGIPVSLMEAMAAGLIVFSSRHSGIPELIENGITGFLIDEGDYINLANSIRATFEIKESNQRQQIAENARKHIEDNFNLATLNLDLQKILNTKFIEPKVY